MDQTIVVQYSLIASALIAAVAAFAAAFGDSKLASHVIDGMTRQPEIQGQLFTSMLVGIGLIESIPDYRYRYFSRPRIRQSFPRLIPIHC